LPRLLFDCFGQLLSILLGLLGCRYRSFLCLLCHLVGFQNSFSGFRGRQLFEPLGGLGNRLQEFGLSTHLRGLQCTLRLFGSTPLQLTLLLGFDLSPQLGHDFTSFRLCSLLLRLLLRLSHLLLRLLLRLCSLLLQLDNLFSILLLCARSGCARLLGLQLCNLFRNLLLYLGRLFGCRLCLASFGALCRRAAAGLSHLLLRLSCFHLSFVTLFVCFSLFLRQLRQLFCILSNLRR